MDEDRTAGLWRWSARIACAVSIAALCLPFVTVGPPGRARVYTGLEIIALPANTYLVAVVLFPAVLLALSFLRFPGPPERRGLLHALRAFSCAVVPIVLHLTTSLTFLEGPVAVRAGLFLCEGSWWALYVLSVGDASGLTSRRPLRARVIGSLAALGLVVLLYLLAALVASDDLLVLAVLAILVTPMLVLARKRGTSNPAAPPPETTDLFRQIP